MDRIDFKINGKKYSVGKEVSSEVTLLDYIRNQLDLRGTKYMCKEGGCGACTVSAIRSEGAETQAVNACLVLIPSCQDWEITTIEDVGNKLKGYSEIQKTLAENNGTQCGYCTPGFVMTMHSLLQNKKPEEITKLEVERYFSGNICRCTGYRPIATAFKTFATKEDSIMDIEDLSNICKNTGKECEKSNCDHYDWCVIDKKDVFVEETKEILLDDGKMWFTVYIIQDIFNTLANHPDKDYMLVNGNTAKGAYPIKGYPDVLIDISRVEELKKHKLDQNLILGAGNSLKETMDIFKTVGKEQYFEYLIKFYEHLELVANTGVRNIGTIGGNLMTKHKHNDFPSDVFLIIETCGGTITTQSANGDTEDNTPASFLGLDMKGIVITNVLFPPLGEEYKLATFKIMPRSLNAVARVNAGFFYKMDKDNDTLLKANIVYGGIDPKFVHAKETESFLIGKKLFTDATLQGALKKLEEEVIVTLGMTDTIKKATKKIALGLFYKGLLKLYPSTTLNSRYKSGAINLHQSRPVSKASEVYDTNPILWPLNQPLNKVEALIQCAGEAPYTDDIPKMKNEVFAAFVLSTIANGEIDVIDPTEALNKKGAVAFYKANDIPGRNTFTPMTPILIAPFRAEEEILCSGNVRYYGQPIGIIVAETEKLAENLANLVKVTYKNVRKPVINFMSAKDDKSRTKFVITVPALDRGLLTTKVFKGTAKVHKQYHFYMEKQVSVTKPADDGIDLYSSCQWPDVIQVVTALTLDVPSNTINQTTRRVGGAFGGKISRPALVAAGCSLVTTKLNRPCRFILPISTNMSSIGARPDCYLEYEVGTNSLGLIQYVNMTLYEDYGYIVNEFFILVGILSIANCYKKRWNFTGYSVVTDKPTPVWMRSPGDLEVISLTEIIMERLSYELAIDPIELRLRNLDMLSKTGERIITMTEKLKKSADYDNRKEAVKTFNKQNRWKKRGLRYAPLRWTTKPYTNNRVTMTVYHTDGTVTITTGGIEIGQGLNTKVIQVCAYTLKISVDKVKVKACNNITGGNVFATAASLTSELVCLGVIKCCEKLILKLKPVKASLGDDNVVWETLVKAAYLLNVDLFTTQQVTGLDLKIYEIYGVAIVEAEVDLLTGEVEVIRVDLMPDVGQSLNPAIDLGQIEGSFIMGLGYWLTEEMIYDSNSGELLTNRPWNYHVPLMTDIPQEFNVYMDRNKYNELGVLGSKATGEPAINSAIAVRFAIVEALSASRVDSQSHSGTSDSDGDEASPWLDIEGAVTIDKVVVSAEINTEEFKF